MVSLGEYKGGIGYFQFGEIRNGFLGERILELGFGGGVECGYMELGKKGFLDRGCYRDKSEFRFQLFRFFVSE